MNGITIDIDPVIAHFGPFMPTWFGLFVALAVLAGGWLGLREARRKGIDPEKMQSLILWGLLGGFVGARLFHVVDRWDLYIGDPVSALYVWEGGLAVYGGLIGGVLAGLLYARLNGLPLWRVLDAAAPGLILGQGLGRLACIPNGDAVGAPTDLPWAFIYTNPASPGCGRNRRNSPNRSARWNGTRSRAGRYTRQRSIEPPNRAPDAVGRKRRRCMPADTPGFYRSQVALVRARTTRAYPAPAFTASAWTRYLSIRKAWSLL